MSKHLKIKIMITYRQFSVKKKESWSLKDSKDLPCLGALSTAVASICSSVSMWLQRPWVYTPVRAKVWLDPKLICTWWLSQTSIYLLLPPPRRADRWTAHAEAEQFWRGWVANIDSMSTLLEEKRGQQRFSHKSNSGPISSHILSGDFSFFLPSPHFPPTFEFHLFFLSFLFC